MSLRSTAIALLLLFFTVCSAAALDLKEITFNTKDAGRVTFSHKRHMKKQGIANNCKSCHNAIYDMKRSASVTMAQMEQGKSCGACHNGKTSFPLSACARCHSVGEISIPVAQTGPVRFSHSRHLAKNGNCRSCHSRLFATGKNKPVGMAQMRAGKSCGACHNGKTAFSVERCVSCHPVREVKFNIKETGPLTFSHTRHLASKGCADCHNKIYAIGDRKHASMKEMERGKSCGACHNGRSAFAVAECSRCHPVRDKVFPVPRNLSLTFSHGKHLKSYSCNSCHGTIYPLGRQRSASMIDMQQGKSCGACHNGGKAFAIAECNRCHPGQKVKYQVKLAGDVTFSHKAHSANYSCASCHSKIFSPGKNRTFTMAEMEDKKSCGACHDGKVAFSVTENCGKCHDMQPSRQASR